MVNTQNTERKLERILARVGMVAHPVKIEASSSDGARESFNVRVILPARGAWPERLLKNGWVRRGDLETHRTAARLLQLDDIASLWRRRNRRRLNMRWFETSKLYRDLARASGHVGSAGDLIPRLYGEVGDDLEVLLDRARYAKPIEDMPIDEVGYGEFRELVLGEFEELQKSFRTERKNRAGAVDVRFNASKVVFVRWLRKIVKLASEIDRKRGGELEPLARRANDLLIETAKHSPECSPAALTAWLNGQEIHSFLREAAEALSRRGNGNSCHFQETAGWLNDVRQKGSDSEKAEALLWIFRNCRNRAALFEELMREVDFVGSYFVGQACRHLYRRIRRLLNRTEKRLFTLMYFQRLPRFGGPSPTFPLGGLTLFFDPVLQSFADDETGMALAVIVTGAKRKSIGAEDLTAKLLSRFKAYLSFYPFWLGLIRHEEMRMRKEQRNRTPRRRQREANVEMVADSESTARAEASKRDWFSDLRSVLAPKDIPGLLARFGFEDRKGVASLRWGEGLSQAEIAAKLSISQQAVSASLRRLTRALVKKMSEEGQLPAGTELPRRRWIPRA